MEYWLNAGFIEVDQLARVAKAAEQSGFTGITLPDHLVFPQQLNSKYPYSADGSISWPDGSPWPDCWVAIAAMAQATTTLRFSTGVYIAPLRDPFTLAKAAGTASLLSEGRVSCGFGAGWMKEEFDLLGVDFSTRGRRFDELLEVIKLMWTGQMIDYHGKCFDFSGMQMCPAAPSIPILIGGNTEAAIRRAARHDGWIGAHDSVEITAGLLTKVNEARSKLGRQAEPFDISITGGFKGVRDAAALAELGVRGVAVPVRILTASDDVSERVKAIEQLSTRFI